MRQLLGNMTENITPLRFHNVYSKGISLSEDGTLARRTKDFGFIFSARPLSTDEKITIKVMEMSPKPMFSSAFCLGITTTDPSHLPFEDIRDFTYLDLIKKMNYTAVPVDKKLCTRNAILTFSLTSTGKLTYEINGKKQEKFIGKSKPGSQTWALIYFFENPVSIKLIKNLEKIPETIVSTTKSQPSNDAEDVNKPPSISTVQQAKQKFLQLEKQSKTDVDQTKPGKQSVFVAPIPNSGFNECSICCEREANSVLYKCAHMCVCYECAMDQWKGRGDGRCPVCRTIIEDVIKPYK